MDERLQKAVEERLQRLQRAAAEGDVDALFSILADDPLVLKRFGKKAFFSTPLHTAVREGKIQFAKEIVNLKPSFVFRRDHLGRSPLHLALEGNHQELKKHSHPHLALEENYQEMEGRRWDLQRTYQELVTWFIKFDSQLVRVKSKGMVTPLHYAAQLDDETNLADFLYVCPSSIQDLTVKCETVVHVAIKNRSCRAFKVLLGCLRHFNKEEILWLEDEEGNNALHTAICENQIEVVKLLVKYMEVNKMNRQGLTALDIFYCRQNSLNAEVHEILVGSKAKRASEVAVPRHGSKNSLIPVQYFLTELSFAKRFLTSLGLGDRSINKVPIEVRNMLLVVAVLIATATYQAALSPPGGYWQDDSNFPANNTLISNTTVANSNNKHFAGQMILHSGPQFLFLVYNSTAFYMSVLIIIILIGGFRFSKIIGLSTTVLVVAYILAIFATSLGKSKDSLLSSLLLYVMVLFAAVPFIIPYFIYLQERQFKRYGGVGKRGKGKETTSGNLGAA